MLWGAALTGAVAAVVRVIGGTWRATAAAALLFALFSGARIFDGQFVNGEILAALPSTVCIGFGLIGLRQARSRRRLGLLLAAGLVGGCAFLIKQSGADAVLALCAWTILRRTAPRLGIRRRLSDLGAVAGGAALVVGAAALHGASVGFHEWTMAMIGSRVGQVSQFGTSYKTRLFASLVGDLLTYLPALLLAVWIAATKCRRHPDIGLLWLWLCAGIAGFLGGGLFWHHYFLALFPVLCVLAGLAVESLLARNRSRLVVAIAALAVIPIAFLSAPAALPLNENPYFGHMARTAKYVRSTFPHAGPIGYLMTPAMTKGLVDLPAVELPLKSIYGTIQTDQVPSVVSRLNSEERPRVIVADYAKPWPRELGTVAASLGRHYRAIHSDGPFEVLVAR